MIFSWSDCPVHVRIRSFLNPVKPWFSTLYARRTQTVRLFSQTKRAGQKQHCSILLRVLLLPGSCHASRLTSAHIGQNFGIRGRLLRAIWLLPASRRFPVYIRLMVFQAGGVTDPEGFGCFLLLLCSREVFSSRRVML